MKFDVGTFTQIAKQFLGAFLGIFQVSTADGQGIMKIIDFFGALGDLFVRAITAIGALFSGSGS